MSRDPAPRHIPSTVCGGVLTPKFNMNNLTSEKCKIESHKSVMFLLKGSILLSYNIVTIPLCSPLSGSLPSMSSLSCGEARDSRTGLTATPSIRHLGSRTPRSSAHVYPLQRSRPLERPISPFWLHPRFPEHISALLRSCLYGSHRTQPYKSK
jgi:hypothetical protein